ncbi:hypothetical protein HY990_05715 [Candidatus Micrarchaeota archaeon]|nr:hypothetical protein [Candidatus Micrarchaeota archaeon]
MKQNFGTFGFYLALLVLPLILLFGCVTNEKVQSKDDLVRSLSQNSSPLMVRGDSSLFLSAGDTRISTLKVLAKEAAPDWRFPLSDYPGVFDGVGIASDSFVRINRTLLKGLDPSENIWITSYIRGKSHNGTVLFNAIYSKEISDPNATSMMILGKNYSLDYLGQKSSLAFESDDKWKIKLEGNCTVSEPTSSYCGFKPTRVVIYLDGYFSDLKEGEQVNLFRNDNSVLFKFVDLKLAPAFELIYTHPLSTVSSLPVSAYFDHYELLPYNFTERQHVLSNGVRITFDPPLAQVDSRGIDRVPIKIKDRTYYLVDFQPNRSVTLGHEKSYSKLHTRDCADQLNPDPNSPANPTWVMIVGGHNLTLMNFSYSDPRAGFRINSFLTDDGSLLNLSGNQTYSFGNESVKFWGLGIGYTYCSNYQLTSVLDEVHTLSSSTGYTLTWDQTNPADPKLVEIFVPASVYSYLKLGQ